MLNIKDAHLNTSHVLIHQGTVDRLNVLERFKYISCSYSSSEVVYTTTLVEKFKYISCSYSSEKAIGAVAVGVKFKYISCSYSSLWSTLMS